MSPENIISRNLKLFPRIIEQVLHKKDPITPLSTPPAEKNLVTNPVARPISEAELESLERLPHLVVTERNHSQFFNGKIG